MGYKDFIIEVEKMIDPMDVGTVHFMQGYASMIPKKMQYQMIKSGAKQNPYMGFVVEPYSFFLCYEIIDIDYAMRLLPDGYELIKTSIFENDEPKYYGIFGTFNVHTSAFWGTRMEFYIIALNKASGLLSWVIIDYDTNTVSFDEAKGLSAQNAKDCIFCTTFAGDILLDIKNHSKNRQITAQTNLKNAQTHSIDQRLWLEGNLSITYGRDLSVQVTKPFSVMFNPDEVQSALKIPADTVSIKLDNWFDGLLADNVDVVACFPFAQHFLSDSPGHHSEIKNRDELETFIEKIDFDNVPRYSSRKLKKSFQVGQVVSSVLIILLTILLILK